jgi:membrane-bound inhibitor of C-type lysozyme
MKDTRRSRLGYKGSDYRSLYLFDVFNKLAFAEVNTLGPVNLEPNENDPRFRRWRSQSSLVRDSAGVALSEETMSFQNTSYASGARYRDLENLRAVYTAKLNVRNPIEILAAGAGYLTLIEEIRDSGRQTSLLSDADDREQSLAPNKSGRYVNVYGPQGIIKQLDFIDSNLVNTKALIKNMESMVQQGLVIQTEADKLKINELTLANTKASLLATKEQLESLMKIYIGYPKDANISFEADKLVENTILVDQSESNFLALKMIDSQKKMNEEEKKGIKMGYLPNLSFYAAYNYNVNIKPEDNFRKGIDGAFLGLRLDWNLFDGLEKYHKAKMNALNKEKIDNQYELLSQQLEMTVDNNRKQIEVKAGALSITKEQLQLAENIHKNAVLKFKQGLSGSNDLILAENGLQQAQTNVVSAYIQLRQAELEYLKSIGNIK